MANDRVKEISVFVDESGSYDSDVASSLYYMVCLVFHDQDVDIASGIRKLEEELVNVGKPSDHCIHTSPLIRREAEYENDLREERRSLFYKMLTFVRRADVRYKCFQVAKEFIDSDCSIHQKLKRDMTEFLVANAGMFAGYDRIKVYYDNGQDQVKKILEESFAACTGKAEFVSEVTPAKYRLFQAADMICTLELIRLRIEDGHGLNKAEKAFFGNARLFKRNVIGQIESKELG